MDGIIIIDKPKGITSFDVIRKLRKILKFKKIGHTGTLDPLATGLMILCLGKATKLAADLEAEDKIYEAHFDLGYLTDTYDIEGKILDKKNKVISKEDLQESISKFIGNIKQIPPMYSAIKVQGKKLYELARKGIEIERKERDIKIDFIELLDFSNNKAKIRAKVSKGCYIRSLIFDIAQELETYGTMTELRREQVGKAKIENAFTIEKIEEMVKDKDFSFLISIEDKFNYEKFYLNDEKQKILFLNGNTVKLKEKSANKRYRIYFKDKFLGLAEIKNEVLLKGYKYF
ncbi:MAG: tRNA pseudouridine(55) synthase TruB [Fusobacterium sp.]|nr:tRNA pseudouridine(55) synthase TruB [Fusobacterium sp.]